MRGSATRAALDEIAGIAALALTARSGRMRKARGSGEGTCVSDSA